MFRRLMLGSVLLFFVGASLGWSQDVPLENCRQLPMVKVKVGKRQFQFLLDTGASVTLLNEKTFSSLDSTEIMMESWNGPKGAPAYQVTLPDLSIGDQILPSMKLLAVDLTQLERSCQRRVDGVMGADLITRLGITIDLKNRLVSMEANSKSADERFHQLRQEQFACEEAFNHSEEKSVEQCLDPDVVLITSKGEFHGRKEVMKHFRESYFGQTPPVEIALEPLGKRVIGSVIWVEYDMSVTSGKHNMKAHASVLYQKAGEHWVMSNMNFAANDVARAEQPANSR